MRETSVNGTQVSYIDEGSGPLVVLLHGFPENSHSWRYQVEALSAEGYRVIAPDLRGFGRSGQPEQVDAYTILHFVGDLVGLLADVGADEAVVVGHDWGAVVAWGIAMMRPDLVRGVIGISGPPQIPRGPIGLAEASRHMFTDSRRHYLDYLQEIGPADAEFDRDPRAALRGMIDVLSYDYPVGDTDERMVVQPGRGLLDTWRDPGRLPAWLPEEHFDLLAAPYEQHGFTSALGYYRNLDRDWELTAPFEGFRLLMPSMLILGEKDVVRAMLDNAQLVENLPKHHPGFRGTLIVPGAGHWVQQEQPQAVSKAILEFVKDLPDGTRR
jgi:pimeloyl-ACP methyl ester carboxylesterase